MHYRFAFPAIVEPWHEGGFAVRFRAPLDWVVSWPADRESIPSQARDALETALAHLATRGEPLPRPPKGHAGDIVVTPGPIMSAKAALYEAMRETGTSNVALAAKLGVAETEVRRMLSPKHNTKIERLDKALQVFGRHIIVHIAAE